MIPIRNRPHPHPPQTRQNLWARNFTDADLKQIRQIHFYISPHYSTHRVHSFSLPYLISFFRTLFAEAKFLYPGDGKGVEIPSLVTTSVIEPRNDTLYILLYYHDLHNHITRLPNIYLLVNTMDMFDSSFIHPANIALFTKAYRIIDTKYINLQHYIKEIRPKTFYLPIIFDAGRSGEATTKKTVDILFYFNVAPRTQLVYSLLLSRISQEMPEVKCAIYNPQVSPGDAEELFDESRMVVRLLDSPNAYYDNLLFSKCIQHDIICISEKSATDVFHENYYFDKVLFDGPINPIDPASITAFIHKIKIYLMDAAKETAFKKMMRKENYERNGMQFRKIVGDLRILPS